MFQSDFDKRFQAFNRSFRRTSIFINVMGALIFVGVIGAILWSLSLGRGQRARYQCADAYNPEQCVKMLTE